MRRHLLLAFAVSACTQATPLPVGGARVTTAPSASPSATAQAVTAAVDAAAPPAATVPESKIGWKTTPTEKNGFYTVVDGLCSKLGFGRLGSDVVLYYGGAPLNAMDTTQRTGRASFIGLRESGLEGIGDPAIWSPTGLAGRSLDDFWIADSTGSRSSEGAMLHRRVNGAWKTYGKDQTNLHAWIDGGIIGTGGMNSNGEVWVEGSTTKPPAALSDGLLRPRLAAFPTGEVTVLARKGSDWETAPWIARHWSPSTQVKEVAMPMLAPNDWPSFVETAPDELYVYELDTAVMYDGTSWKTLGKTTKHGNIVWAKRAAKGELWVRLDSGGVERSTEKGFVPVATPEPLASIDGIDVGAAWAVGQSGKLYKRGASGEWTEVKMPGPTFGTSAAVKAKDVLVGRGEDVLVHAAYWEKGPGWTEPELHHALFRTKPPKETMRCNEPDPENNNVEMGRGFQSWPPLATADCKTPFVVLARRSHARPTVQETDWRAIRGALKGKAELAADRKLVELVSGDRTFLGARAKDFESAKTMVKLAAARDRIRPEIVCGEPPATTHDWPLE